MKLLLDENLSRRIVPFLQNDYPDTTQVALVGLEQMRDEGIWQYAKDHGFVIVTKDSDYYDLSLLQGAPPQVIWLKTGNTSKAKITKLLLDNRANIERLLLQDDVACVEIY
jgi:predicted nuclease of predicted toxin-antitoxin system